MPAYSVEGLGSNAYIGSNIFQWNILDEFRVID